MTDHFISPRRFGAIAGGAVATLAVGSACAAIGALPEVSDGRLAARPSANAPTAITAGQRALGLDARRDAILQVPDAPAGTKLPLLLLLHGATGSGEGMLRRLGSAPADAGIAVLSPDSRDGTWDAIRGNFGPDVAFLDRALTRVFETVPIDPSRITIGGFSDGATYALSLGLINGDLFTRIVAFSPGFIVDGPPHGHPPVFISHGGSDQILPIEQTSLVIVPVLRRRGYDVTFREFDGRHEVPPAIAADAMKWIAGPPAAKP